MDFQVLLGMILFISTVQVVRAQDPCPGNADICLQQAGISQGVGDPTTFCVEMPKKLDKAGLCLQRCSYNPPPSYSQAIENLASTCSARAGCSNFTKDYEAFRKCYNSTEDLKRLVDAIIVKYNSRTLLLEDCINLRAVRNCLKRSSLKCFYVGKIFNDLSESLRKFDVALHICGAENVYTPLRTDGCTSVSSNIEANCDVACELTAAATAGDICNLLQKQSNCIYGFSEKCTEAQVAHLLPRLSSYSLVNQLFRCNVSVDGVLVLPSFGLECKYKEVLKQCFGIDASEGIPLLDVKKLLDGALPKDPVCSKYSSREEALLNCSRSLWACSIPLAQIYPRKTTESEFNSHLGTFPLNELGLRLLFKSCTSGQSPLACVSSLRDARRTTPHRVPRYTLGTKLQTPARN